MKIKKLIVIVRAHVDHFTYQLSQKGAEQMQALFPYLEKYLKGEKKILMVSASTRDFDTTAKAICEKIPIDYRTDYHFIHDPHHPFDSLRALGTLKLMIEKADADVVIFIPATKYAQELPAEIVKEIKKEQGKVFPRHQEITEDLTLLLGDMVYLNFSNGDCTVHHVPSI